MGHFFSPNSGGDLHSDAHQSQIIGGDADVDHTQIIGGDTVKLLRGIYPPIPPGFRHPCEQFVEMLLLQNKPSLVRYKKIRAMSFLPSLECGKFKLKRGI